MLNAGGLNFIVLDWPFKMVRGGGFSITEDLRQSQLQFLVNEVCDDLVSFFNI